MTFWTDERIAELRRLAPDHTASQIAAKMGASSRNVIIGKMNRLGMSGTRKQVAEAAATVVKIRAKARSEIRANKPKPSWFPAMPRQAPAEPARAFSSTPPVSSIGGRYQCTLAFLTEQTCRFPCWDDSIPQDDRRYCGGKAIEGLPYCRTHADLCYTGQERATLPMRRFA